MLTSVAESSKLGANVSPVPESENTAMSAASSSDMVATTPQSVNAPGHIQSAPVPGMESPAPSRTFTGPLQSRKTSAAETRPLALTANSSPKLVTSVVSTSSVTTPRPVTL